MYIPHVCDTRIYVVHTNLCMLSMIVKTAVSS